MGCGSSSSHDPTTTWAPFAQETYKLYRNLVLIRRCDHYIKGAGSIWDQVQAEEQADRLAQTIESRIKTLKTQYQGRGLNPSYFINQGSQILSEESVKVLIEGLGIFSHYSDLCRIVAAALLSWYGQGQLTDVPGFEHQLRDEELGILAKLYTSEEELNTARDQAIQAQIK